MRIYLDVSSLNRPFDDQSQPRVRIEAEAVTLILEQCRQRVWKHVSSDMALVEIAANSDVDKQRKVRRLLPQRRDILTVDDLVLARARSLTEKGFRLGDAVHVAAAEAQKADALLTCDDRLVRVARRHRAELSIGIVNPLDWLREQSNASDT